MIRKGDYESPLALLGQVLEGRGVQVEEKSGIHFLLGSLRDKVGRYDSAFHHYQKANRLKGVQFNKRKFRGHVSGMLEYFSSDMINCMPRSDCDSRLPLFIVGSPRSGTSLVEQILDSHPDVHGAGELPDITRIVEGFVYLRSGAADEDPGVRITSALLNEKASLYLDKLRLLSPGAIHITDKLPGNYFNLGYIALMFPNARIIHVSRNPLDTCLSCYFHDFTGIHTYAYDLGNLGTFYNSYTELMQHWKQVLPLQIHELVYEDLVANPESEIRRLLDYCGLSWDEDCLNYHCSKRRIRTASYDQASRPIYKSSVHRWRNYERHLGPLIDTLDAG